MEESIVPKAKPELKSKWNVIYEQPDKILLSQNLNFVFLTSHLLTIDSQFATNGGKIRWIS